MKTTRRLLAAFAVILLGPALALAAPAKKPSTKPAAKPKALFTSVKGTVEVKRGGAKAKPAKKDATAAVGDRIVTAKNSSAVLRFFDGTELKISPATELKINQLTEGEKDKTLKFKLYLGKLLANVKKLASPRSSFEIEAGGVVCGVRGTTYSMEYDPTTNTLNLDVEEGTVFSSFNGEVNTFTAGESGEFHNGNLQGPGNDNQNSGLPNPNGSTEGVGDVDVLADLDQTVGTGLVVNGDNSFNDPSVGGGVKVNVLINIDPSEALP